MGISEAGHVKAIKDMGVLQQDHPWIVDEGKSQQRTRKVDKLHNM